MIIHDQRVFFLLMEVTCQPRGLGGWVEKKVRYFFNQLILQWISLLIQRKKSLIVDSKSCKWDQCMVRVKAKCRGALGGKEEFTGQERRASNLDRKACWDQGVWVGSDLKLSPPLPVRINKWWNFGQWGCLCGPGLSSASNTENIFTTVPNVFKYINKKEHRKAGRQERRKGGRERRRKEGKPILRFQKQWKTLNSG